MCQYCQRMFSNKFNLKQVITNIYISMNNTMLAALETAENMIKLAQDATKEGPFSPFINAGLEQLNIATVELSRAMKRVGIDRY